jgi:hypothetical protein
MECDYRRGFGLEIGFFDHFNTQLVTTLNYNAIADLHILKFPQHTLGLYSLLGLHQSFLANGF